MQNLSIYIHIPFCVKKCLYCDFLSDTADDSTKQAYMEALIKEVEGEADTYRGYRVDTLFIGGGTPSIVDTGQLEQLLARLASCYRISPSAEISMEVNPGTVSKEGLIRYKQAGINRLSIGAQSMLGTELCTLGRIHSVEDFEKAFTWARGAGFDNINVDLMAALPGQSIEDYRKSLREISEFSPDHISAYSLIVEEGTVFGMLQEQGKLSELPSEDVERRMDQETEAFLKKHGYHRYEISNYARPGKECRHNTVYWTRGDYAGFGIGAASMVDDVRSHNITEIGEYIEALTQSVPPRNAVREKQVILTIKEQMEEFMFLGLRLTKGVTAADFYKKFGCSINDIYADVMKLLVQQKLLVIDERIYLTPYGRDISNYVMAQFLQDEQKCAAHTPAF